MRLVCKHKNADKVSIFVLIFKHERRKEVIAIKSKLRNKWLNLKGAEMSI